MSVLAYASRPGTSRPLADPSRHAAPQVFDALRDMIMSLQLVPGAVLSRVDLQAQFRLSSTPIRDALFKLQEEGLVEIYPQRATVVSLIDIPMAQQAQFLRRSIEQEVVRVLALAPDKALLRQLRAMIADQKNLAAKNDLEGFSAADRAFHKLLYDAAGAPGLWFLVRRHSGHIDRIRRLCLPAAGKYAEIVRDHTAVVKAIAGGDPHVAQGCLRDHLSRSIAHWDDMRGAFPGYFRD
jgi:GntR family transcriptional regulator, rspAB operon transcriptional repressor